MGIEHQRRKTRMARLLILAVCLAAVVSALPSQEMGAQDEQQPKVQQKMPFVDENGKWQNIPTTFNIVDQVEEALSGTKRKLGEGAGAKAGFTNQGRFAWDMSTSSCASQASDEIMTKFCQERPKLHCNGIMRDWFCDQSARLNNDPKYEVMCPTSDDKQGKCLQIIVGAEDGMSTGRCCSWNTALADP